VRHPIYAGYLLTHAAFVVAHPTMSNIVLVVASDGALILRALYEERTLLNDEGYRGYCGRVRWHFAPGIF
jgi:protein-S-isoprenylcysteine O-methyltransferase Ste14